MTDTLRPDLTTTDPGVVAYLRLPLPCASAELLGAFISLAYGPDCVASFSGPTGWLKIMKPPLDTSPAAV